MEGSPTTPNARNIAELASLGYTEGDIAGFFKVAVSTIRYHFAAELAEGRAELEIKLQQFRDDFLSLEGGEAIFWERYLIKHVRVSRIRVSNAYVSASLEVIPFCGEKGGSGTVGCAWQYFHTEKLLWLSKCQGAQWRVFFASAVIDEVTRIRSAFPSSDKFEPYDSHYFPLVKPLQMFLGQKASDHLPELNELLHRIEMQKEVSPKLRTALERVAAALPSDPQGDGIDKLLTFLVAAESESGKALTKGEADQLIQGAYLVGRALGGPF